MSLEPLKPFRAIVEVFVKRKTGGGRWRYEVKVEATDAPPDDHISLRASVGEASSAMFRLCNRYLGYAPFQVLHWTNFLRGEMNGMRGENRRKVRACVCRSRTLNTIIYFRFIRVVLGLFHGGQRAQPVGGAGRRHPDAVRHGWDPRDHHLLADAVRA